MLVWRGADKLFRISILSPTRCVTGICFALRCKPVWSAGAPTKTQYFKQSIIKIFTWIINEVVKWCLYGASMFIWETYRVELEITIILLLFYLYLQFFLIFLFCLWTFFELFTGVRRYVEHILSDKYWSFHSRSIFSLSLHVICMYCVSVWIYVSHYLFALNFYLLKGFKFRE